MTAPLKAGDRVETFSGKTATINLVMIPASPRFTSWAEITYEETGIVRQVDVAHLKRTRKPKPKRLIRLVVDVTPEELDLLASIPPGPHEGIGEPGGYRKLAEAARARKALK